MVEEQDKISDLENEVDDHEEVEFGSSLKRRGTGDSYCLQVLCNSRALDVSNESQASFDDNLTLSQTELSQRSDVSSDIAKTFKKYPVLNKCYMKETKDGREKYVCLGCNFPYTQCSGKRLLLHAQKCKNGDQSIKTGLPNDFPSITRETKHEKLRELWCLAMVKNHFPLRSLDSKELRAFFNYAIPDWVVGSRRSFSENYIPAHSKKIDLKFNSTITREKDIYVSVEFDHWRDLSKRSYLGIVATLQDGRRHLLDLWDVSTEGHFSNITVSKLREVLKRVPANKINSLISDHASSCRKAREDFVKENGCQHIIEHRCMAHLLNLIGSKLIDLEPYKSTVAWAKQLSGAISGSTALIGKLRDAGKKNIVIACQVRWYSHADMVESLLQAEDVIVEQIDQLRDQSSRLNTIKASVLRKDEWLKLSKIYPMLRSIAKCIQIAERADGSLGETVKSILEFAKNLFLQDLEDPYNASAITALMTYFGPSVMNTFQFGLMLASYILDRRNNLDYVTQVGLNRALFSILKIGLKEGISLEEVENSLATEYNSYCTLKGRYAKTACESETALNWWVSLGNSGHLVNIARRIVALRSSSANIERLFSSLKYIQGLSNFSYSRKNLVNVAKIKMTIESDDEDWIDLDTQPDGIEGNSRDICTCSSCEIPNEQPSTSTPDMSTEDEIVEVVVQANLLPLEIRANYIDFLRVVDFTKRNPRDIIEPPLVVNSDDAALLRIAERASLKRVQMNKSL